LDILFTQLFLRFLTIREFSFVRVTFVFDFINSILHFLYVWTLDDDALIIFASLPKNTGQTDTQNDRNEDGSDLRMHHVFDSHVYTQTI